MLLGCGFLLPDLHTLELKHFGDRNFHQIAYLVVNFRADTLLVHRQGLVELRFFYLFSDGTYSQTFDHREYLHHEDARSSSQLSILIRNFLLLALQIEQVVAEYIDLNGYSDFIFDIRWVVARKPSVEALLLLTYLTLSHLLP